MPASPKRLDADLTLLADAALVERVVSGDGAAVGEIYDRHAPRIFSVVFRILRERTEAEDALQDVFVRVWKRAETYNAACGNVATWLLRIGRNRAIDRLRMRQRHDGREIMGSTEPGDLQSAADDPAAMLEDQETTADILSGVDTLARDMIECAYFEGYTQSELALKFNLPIGTVKTRIRRALQAIRQRHRPQ